MDYGQRWGLCTGDEWRVGEVVRGLEADGGGYDGVWGKLDISC